MDNRIERFQAGYESFNGFFETDVCEIQTQSWVFVHVYMVSREKDNDSREDRGQFWSVLPPKITIMESKSSIVEFIMPKRAPECSIQQLSEDMDGLRLRTLDPVYAALRRHVGQMREAIYALDAYCMHVKMIAGAVKEKKNAYPDGPLGRRQARLQVQNTLLQFENAEHAIKGCRLSLHALFPNLRLFFTHACGPFLSSTQVEEHQANQWIMDLFALSGEMGQRLIDFALGNLGLMDEIEELYPSAKKVDSVLYEKTGMTNEYLRWMRTLDKVHRKIRPFLLEWKQIRWG